MLHMIDTTLSRHTIDYVSVTHRLRCAARHLEYPRHMLKWTVYQVISCLLFSVDDEMTKYKQHRGEAAS
jgi:hypothetical protein